MAKQRNINNSDLPVGLYQANKNGQLRYKFRRVDKSEKWLPSNTSRAMAIAAANDYNAKFRDIDTLAIEESKRQFNGSHKDKYNKPLVEWIPIVLKRIKCEEKIAIETFKTIERESERLLELHAPVLSKSWGMEHVNAFLAKYTNGKSNNVYNRKISFLMKIESYLLDESAIVDNPASRKKMKPKEEKDRLRLSLEAYEAIYQGAPLFLKVAMSLSLQTTHAVNEISKVKYSDIEYLNTPIVQDNLKVFGYLKIHRQKTKHKEASRVSIPVTQAILDIIELSQTDILISPFVVHKAQNKRNTNPLSQECEHRTQLTPSYLSKAFSRVRDELKLFEHLKMKQRPSFHEIRALAAHLYDKQGHDPQKRMAHSDSKSTEIYKANHQVWKLVPAAEIKA
ncbi:tyrosine-type recombinase/integrase [Marinifaba aquimaris]|uniref:tyrosine-type recombinase/integrase n=1 Tax=Marinifaba aquimaris TaxID=2741323 RepID=UPI001C2D0C55|nr:tyrosine-type recombinase/integrase [Marinifaba aquimaris]